MDYAKYNGCLRIQGWDAISVFLIASNNTDKLSAKASVLLFFQ